MVDKIAQFKNALQNKVILFTGGGGGIGLEAVKVLLYMGAKIIVAEKDYKKIKIAKNILNTTSIKLYFFIIYLIILSI